MGIQSSVFRSNQLFLWSKEQFNHEKDRIAPFDLIKRSTGSICSWLIFFLKIEDQRIKRLNSQTLPTGTMIREENLIIGFSIEWIVFCDRKIDSIQWHHRDFRTYEYLMLNRNYKFFAKILLHMNMEPRNMRKTKLVKQIFNIRNVLVSFFLTILFLCKASQNPQKS